jgi:hypothetical protein
VNLLTVLNLCLILSGAHRGHRTSLATPLGRDLPCFMLYSEGTGFLVDVFQLRLAYRPGECHGIIAPRQPQIAHAIGCRSRELSPKNLVFGTVLLAVFSASAMGFCVICSMRLSHELKDFSSQLQLVLCAAKDETSVEFMKPLLNSWAECSVAISCGKVDYDKSG